MLRMLSWLVLAAALALLLPSVPSMLPAIHQGAIFEWLGSAQWGTRIGLLLLLLFPVLRLTARCRGAAASVVTRSAVARLLLRHRRGEPSAGTVSFHGIRWLTGTHRAESSNPELTAKLPPHCPRCMGKLEETTFHLGYRWRCTRCRFRRISPVGFARVADELVELGRQTWTELAARTGPPAHHGPG